MDDGWELRGRIAEASAGGWLEVVDLDGVLHDVLAAGPLRADGTFRIRFDENRIRQQWWEFEQTPDLEIRYWKMARWGEQPGSERGIVWYPQVDWSQRVVDLGDLQTQDAVPGVSWTRLLNQSGGLERDHAAHSQLYDEVWNELCPMLRERLGEKKPAMETRSGMEAAGQYDAARHTVVIFADATRSYVDDQVRSLFAHELAHAATFLSHPKVFRERAAPTCTADVVRMLANFANVEGFAHYVEERYALASGHVGCCVLAVDDPDLRAEIVPLAITPVAHMRRVGLQWYRDHYRGKTRPLSFLPEAARDLRRIIKGHLKRVEAGELPREMEDLIQVFDGSPEVRRLLVSISGTMETNWPKPPSEAS